MALTVICGSWRTWPVSGRGRLKEGRRKIIVTSSNPFAQSGGNPLHFSHYRTLAKHDTSRKFGVLIAVALALTALYFWWSGSSVARVLACAAAAAAFVVVAVARPAWLSPATRLWLRLGELLGRVVNPLVLGLLFFGLITPVAWVGRKLGRDPLRLASYKDPQAQTYWVSRGKGEPTAASFKNQF